MEIKRYRPHVTLVEIPIGTSSPTRLAAAICYDATDLDLAADLRDRSNVFLVSALNQDVQTFDNMLVVLQPRFRLLNMNAYSPHSWQQSSRGQCIRNRSSPFQNHKTGTSAKTGKNCTRRL